MILRWMPAAAADLERISRYLRENAPDMEHRIVLQIYEGIKSLPSMPHKGRPTKRDGRRQLIFPDIRYIVTYRVAPQAIEVLRIRHGSQKPLTF